MYLHLIIFTEYIINTSNIMNYKTIDLREEVDDDDELPHAKGWVVSLTDDHIRVRSESFRVLRDVSFDISPPTTHMYMHSDIVDCFMTLMNTQQTSLKDAAAVQHKGLPANFKHSYFLPMDLLLRKYDFKQLIRYKWLRNLDLFNLDKLYIVVLDQENQYQDAWGLVVVFMQTHEIMWYDPYHNVISSSTNTDDGDDAGFPRASIAKVAQWLEDEARYRGGLSQGGPPLHLWTAQVRSESLTLQQLDIKESSPIRCITSGILILMCALYVTECKAFSNSTVDLNTINAFKARLSAAILIGHI